MRFQKWCSFFLGWLALLAPALPSRADAPHWPLIQLSSVCDASHPVDLQNAADGSGRLFIVQQDGQILILKNGTLNSAPFLDLRSRVRLQNEQGLLGLAFPPGYATKLCFYVFYSRASDGASVVSRFRLTSADVADPASEEVLLLQPQSYDNHKGGQLAFGPDGFLYIALGDGGSEGDPAGNGQSLTTLLGKILRIQVENTPQGVPYLIPDTNPFANDATKAKEILFWGLRNPWRFCFDRATGDLFIGDVGQDKWEEIDHISAAQVAEGGNFGWSLKEGAYDFKNPGGISSGLIPPVWNMGRPVAYCVIGGRVHRGANQRLQGFYYFGDYGTGRIFGMELQSGAFQAIPLGYAGFSIGAFGEDEAGELFVIANGEVNGVYRLEASETMPAPTISPHAGVYTNSVAVTIAPPLPGISIHYTLDGSAPTPASPELPAGQNLMLTDPATVTAIAYRDDLPPSVSVSAKYQLYVDSV